MRTPSALAPTPIPVLLVLLGCLSLPAGDCGAEEPAAIGFFLEPGLQYGRAVEQQRFRESRQRIFFDVGAHRRWGAADADQHRVGLSLHGSLGSRDAWFALRPRYSLRLTEMVRTTFSAGWIFATPQQDNAPEDATLSENGFIAGAQVSHGDIAFGVDVRVLEVGPSINHEGGTETMVLAGVSFLGKPGVQAAAFGAGILLLLSALYVASL